MPRDGDHAGRRLQLGGALLPDGLPDGLVADLMKRFCAEGT